MNRDFFPELVPTADLAERVVVRLRREEKKRDRRNLFLSAASVVVSLGALVPALMWFLRDIMQSGFIQFSSLIFSDGVALVGYWREFGLSLLESLPFGSLVTCLVILLVAVASLQMFLVSFRHSRQIKFKLNSYA